MTSRFEIVFELDDRRVATQVVQNGGVLVLRADALDAREELLEFLVGLAPRHSRVVVDPGPRHDPADLVNALRYLVLTAYQKAGFAGIPVNQIFSEGLDDLLDRLSTVTASIPGGALLVLRDIGRPNVSSQLRLNSQGALLGSSLVVTCGAGTPWRPVDSPSIVDLKPMALSEALHRVQNHPRWPTLTGSVRAQINGALRGQASGGRIRLSMLYDVVVQLLESVSGP
jgi:hypothetical protein